MSEEEATTIKREREEAPSQEEADPPTKKVKTEEAESPAKPEEVASPVTPVPVKLEAAIPTKETEAAPTSNGTPASEAKPEEPVEAAPAAEAAATAEPTKTDLAPTKDTAEPTETATEAPTPAAAPAPSSTTPSGLPPATPSGLPTPVDPNVAATITNPNSIVEERGEVSAQYVGKVIGKGGEMLRDLQARSGCRLDVDQNVPHGSPRILTYRGTRKTVDLAKQMVSMLCTPQGSEGALPLGEARRKDLTVPASSVGKIIGRAGEMVRELQSRSQAKIQVDHTGKAFNSDTRSVSIVGTPEAVMKAEEMVMFLVANPLLDAMKAIRMLVDDKLKIGGRWGSGPPYTSMPNQGQGMAPMDGGFGGGPPQHQQYGGGGGYTQGGPPAGHGYGGPPPQHQQGYGGGGGYQQGSETEIYPAAKMYMGRIIGQRGVTINDLQKRSGCDIQINQDVPPGQDCIITIKGARPGIEHTKQMLREIIEMGPGHPYAGGNGQYEQQNNQQQNNQQQGSYQQPNNYMQQQAPIHGGYQQPQGQQMYGHHQQQQQPYGQHHAPPQQYAAPPMQQQQYGMPPYQQPGGYPPQAAPVYGAPPPRQQLPPMAAPPVPMWKSATAADGQVYYYNEKTGETQWDKPPGMP